MQSTGESFQNIKTVLVFSNVERKIKIERERERCLEVCSFVVVMVPPVIENDTGLGKLELHVY